MNTFQAFRLKFETLFALMWQSKIPAEKFIEPSSASTWNFQAFTPLTSLKPF